MAITSVATRLCHNCGREQGHRFHGEYGGRCPYNLAQPLTLWDAVVHGAISRAAAEVGVHPTTAYMAAYDHFAKVGR